VENLDLLLGIVGVFAAFAVFIWQAFDIFSKRVIKPIEINNEKIDKVDEKFTGEIRHIHTKITEITKEIRPNGGSSMKDVQQKIFESVRVLHDRDTFNFYLDEKAKFECDSNALCIRVNDAFVNLTGITETHALGNGWMTFIAPQQQDEFIHNWDLSVKRLTKFEMKVNDSKGRTFIVKASSSNKSDRRLIVGTIEVK